MELNNLIDFMVQNKTQIIVCYLAGIGLVSEIIKLTPTQKDDKIWAKILNVLSYIQPSRFIKR